MTTSHCKTCRESQENSCERRVYTRLRLSNSGREFDACLRGTVKLQRAHGGCLGDQRRRRTWTAAKSSGEPLTGFDPEISEWGNPRRDYLPAHGEYIAMRPPSQGTETSKYLDESKSNETPLVVASERGRA
jgi:hypothetical protein